MTKAPLPANLEAMLPQFGLRNLPQGQAVLFRYDEGELLSREKEYMDYLQFISKGRAKISVSSAEGKTLLFCFNSPGDIIGSIELFGDRIATATAECLSPTEAIAIPIDMNLDFFRSDIEFLYYLCTDLSASFAASSLKSSGNILYTLPVRLCSYIAMTQKNGIFQDKLTNVAELLGVSYRHLLRVLHELCEKGILEKEGRVYRIAKYDELEAIGGDYYLSPRHIYGSSRFEI